MKQIRSQLSNYLMIDNESITEQYSSRSQRQSLAESNERSFTKRQTHWAAVLCTFHQQNRMYTNPTSPTGDLVYLLLVSFEVVFLETRWSMRLLSQRETPSKSLSPMLCHDLEQNKRMRKENRNQRTVNRSLARPFKMIRVEATEVPRVRFEGER